MSNPRSRKDQPMSESMKLRYYVMDLIYRGGPYPVKLPSIRTLAADFGVSASTVSLVLDKIEREGFIEARHGVGVFTKPAPAEWGSTPPLIGLIVGYGRHYFYDKTNWAALARVGLALVESGCNVRHLQLCGLSEDAVFDEVANSHLDGLVWIKSDELTAALLSRLEDAGIPVVNVNNNFPSFNSVEYSGEARVEEAARAVAAAIERLVKRKERGVEHVVIGGEAAGKGAP